MEYLANGSGEGQTRVRVDVNLANGALRSLAELLLGDTNCVRQLATVLVNHVYILLRNRRRAVENDWEAWQLNHNLIQDVECQWRRNELAGLGVAGALLGSELVSTMRSTDRDSQ